MTTEEMGAEERLVWVNRLYVEMIKRMLQAIEERYGAEGRQVAANALYDVGRDLAAKIRDLLNVTGKEPIDYARVHCYMDTNLWAIVEQVVPGEGGEAVIRATFCPAQGIFSPRDCKVFLPFVQGMMDAINPELKWKVNKVLTKGDDCCEFIVSKKD